MPIVQFNVQGRPFSLGWLIAFLVVVACFILWLVDKNTPSMELGLIAALGVAYLIG